jgi:tight adherence protein B
VNSSLAAAALASIAAGGVAYVFIHPLLSGEARAEKRQKALTDRGPERRTDRIATVNRRDQVAQSLRTSKPGKRRDTSSRSKAA